MRVFLIVLIVLLLGAGTMWLFSMKQAEQQFGDLPDIDTYTYDDLGNPRVIDNSGDIDVDPDPSTLTVSLAGGSVVNIAVDSSLEELSNRFYRVVPRDPIGSETYAIYFDEPSGHVMIMLYEKPIVLARARAEAILVGQLGITEEEACRLDIEVITNILVDPRLSGGDLGLSFCPGSVKLE